MKFKVGNLITENECLAEIFDVIDGHGYRIYVYNKKDKKWLKLESDISILHESIADTYYHLATPNDCYKILTGKEYKEEPKLSYKSYSGPKPGEFLIPGGAKIDWDDCVRLGWINRPERNIELIHKNEIKCECGIHSLSDGKSRPIEAHLKRCPIRLNSK